MLPVVICEEERLLREQWLNVLDELAHRDYPMLRLEVLSGTQQELNRMLASEQGIMLVVLAISRSQAPSAGVEVFRQIMANNRDNYVLLCLHDSAQLGEVLAGCMRPAGVLMIPVRYEDMRASLRRVLNDYLSLYAPEDAAVYMTVAAGRTLRRIAYRDILYFEARDKMLRICLGRSVISIRGSLNAKEKALPEQFIRCHRSYIVNVDFVERLDQPRMILYLTTGEGIPVSRSYKDALWASLRAGGRT